MLLLFVIARIAVSVVVGVATPFKSLFLLVLLLLTSINFCHDGDVEVSVDVRICKFKIS